MFIFKSFKVFVLSVLLVPFFVFAEEIGEEIDLSSAVITAKTCAEKAAETLDFNYLLECPPNEGAKSGYVIYDPSENEYYYIKLGKLYLYQLEELYSTSGREGKLSAEVKIIGKKDDKYVVDLVEIEEIKPRPKAGFFKGCL